MNFIYALAFVLVSGVSSAQTMHELKIKKEMIERVEILIVNAREIREDLKTQKVITACEKVDEMFELYPGHLKSLGSHLDLSKSKANKAINEALLHQVYLHKQSLQCKRGKDSEHVDMRVLGNDMKNIGKTLEKHRKLIMKSDTDHDNSFTYEYEF